MQRLSSWETPAHRLPRKKVGEAEVVTEFYEPGPYELYHVPDPDGEEHALYEAVERLPITVLKVGGKTVMVDDPPHWWMMKKHAEYYSGRVLVAGLGLGLILHALDAEEHVEDIVVVERSQDVVDLVLPSLDELDTPIEVVVMDWHDFPDVTEARERDFDGVFFDLFVGDGPSLVGMAMREMIWMTERFPEAKTRRIHGMNNDFLEALSRGLGRMF